MNLVRKLIDEKEWHKLASEIAINLNSLAPELDPNLLQKLELYDQQLHLGSRPIYTACFIGNTVVSALAYHVDEPTIEFPNPFCVPLGHDYLIAPKFLIASECPEIRAQALITSLEGMNWLHTDGHPSYKLSAALSVPWVTNGFSLAHSNLTNYVSSRSYSARSDMRRVLRQAEVNLVTRVTNQLPNYTEELLAKYIEHVVDKIDEQRVTPKSQKAIVDLEVAKYCETRGILVCIEVLYKEKPVALNIAYQYDNNVYDLMCLRDLTVTEVYKMGTGIVSVLKNVEQALVKGYTGLYLLSSTGDDNPYKNRFNDSPLLTYNSMAVLTQEVVDKCPNLHYPVIIDGVLSNG